MTQLDHDGIRRRLMARRAELIDRSTRVEHDLERRNEAPSADFADYAVQIQNDEVLSAIGTGVMQEIAAIDAAMQRLDANSYGMCAKCGKPILASRLQAVPHATRCTSCSEATAKAQAN